MTEAWKSYYLKFMMVWAIIGHTWLLLQAIEVYQTENAEGLSQSAFVILMISGLLWFTYGYFALPVRNYVIATSSSISTILTLVIIIGISKFQKVKSTTVII
jgi:uncharacterized protein with PQ loop repeat